MGVLPTWMCVHTCVQCPREPEEDVRFPGSCNCSWLCIAMWVPGSNSKVLEEQPLLLIPEPSFQLSALVF